MILIFYIFIQIGTSACARALSACFDSLFNGAINRELANKVGTMYGKLFSYITPFQVPASRFKQYRIYFPKGDMFLSQLRILTNIIDLLLGTSFYLHILEINRSNQYIPERSGGKRIDVYFSLFDCSENGLRKFRNSQYL